MKDPEFIRLRNRFLLGIVVALLFAIPLLIFVVQKFGNNSTDVLNLLNKKESIIIYMKSNNCTICPKIEEVLDEKKVKYYEINIDSSNDYSKIMEKIKLSPKVMETPGIIHVVDGNMSANMLGIKDEEMLLSFLEAHNLMNTAQ